MGERENGGEGQSNDRLVRPKGLFDDPDVSKQDDAMEGAHIEHETPPLDDSNEAALFRSIAKRAGLGREQAVMVGERLQGYKKDFLLELAGELENVRAVLGEHLPSRREIEKYVPDILAWIEDTERSKNRESIVHGPAHFLRVLINAKMLTSLIEAQLPAQLDDLTSTDGFENYAIQEGEIDRQAIDVAAVGHDMARYDDEPGDREHGERAAKTLEEDQTVFSEIQGSSRKLAQEIMEKHSQSDSPILKIEVLIVKDSDLLDRHRDYHGPNPDYIRLEVTKEIDAIAFVVAIISDSLIEEGGHDQVDAVIMTARALGLFKDEQQLEPV